ncbi:MAG: amidohydrolase [Hyphomonadaceae bacterium]|nr:amidohydrolase [Hyphomonadaceae bacterium]
MSGLSELELPEGAPLMVSADSHVMEPDAVWDALPKHLRAKLPEVKFGPTPAGGADAVARIKDQAADGVVAEILFPNYGMVLFGLDDVELQQEAFRIYNDWLADFCKTAPRRLFGVPCISLHDVDAGVKELERAHAMGLVGAMIWQVPDPRLPFMSEHYEKFWAAAAEMRAPVNCHILTGHSYAMDRRKAVGAERIRKAVNQKQDDTIRTLFDLIFSGAFERHPALRVVLAESEIGWAPFILQQWDYYFERFGATDDMPIRRRPSEIFAEHVYVTFLEDFAGTRNFSWWGQRNCMWSNDYPHFNMTFPHSRQNVARHLSGLSEDVRRRLVRDNAVELYRLDI